ncbi:MAG: signal peptidase I [Kiritimatiellaeota bacterium]|nr:signal peptidase I [Kiritimatiellota bacterium]
MIFERHHWRKRLKESLKAANTLFLMREDLLAEEDRDLLLDAMTLAREARGGGDTAAMRVADAALNDAMGAVTPRVSFPAMRGLFDTWVTALAVAMAFRAYFYQPFRIPTNSMYPTLYGITSVDGGKQWHDETPLTKIPKWLLTASWYKEVVSEETGVFAVSGQGPKPGYGVAQKINGSGKLYHIPTDAVYRMEGAGKFRLDPSHPGTVMDVHRGQTLWEGRVTLGDFVFVNRWIWNFRRPQRGEVMVFSTEGIIAPKHQNVTPLAQGQHYIKRMAGVPGDEIEIRPPNLIVNGEPLGEPEMIRLISSRGQLGAWARPFAGYTLPADLHKRPGRPPMPPRNPINTQLLHWGDTVKLDKSSYYAMGDNSPESSDSRYWGVVPEKNLLGPGAVVYWPFINPRWGIIR